MSNPKVICCSCGRIFVFIPGITSKCPACGKQYGTLGAENDSSKEEK